jgi:hypothetical protein
VERCRCVATGTSDWELGLSGIDRERRIIRGSMCEAQVAETMRTSVVCPRGFASKATVDGPAADILVKRLRPSSKRRSPFGVGTDVDSPHVA